MALITKPDFTYVWASGGAVVAPNDTKKQLGWVAEAPPFQYDNWLQNRQDQMLAHINQRGIPAWDGLTNYEAGGLSYVQGSDGKIYKSVAASGPSATVQNPTTDGTDTYWAIAFADVGAFLTQAAGDTRYTQRSNNLSDVTNVAAARTNLALGTAATANVTTGTTDTAAGRVLRVGDFGFNGPSIAAVANADLNWGPFAKTDANSRFQGYSWANMPEECSGSLAIVEWQTYSGDWGRQLFVDITWRRSYERYWYSGTTWSPWREIARIDSPAFTGVPTAPTPSIGTRSTAIATMQNFANEFGSSLAANGYQRLPSGLIIQWGVASIAGLSGSAFAYPIAFPEAVYSLVGTIDNVSSSSDFCTVNNTSLIEGAFRLNNAVTRNVSWVAIGK